MSNTLFKKMIADSIKLDLINRINEIEINEDDNTISFSLKRSNAKTKTLNLLDLLDNLDSIIATEMLKEGYILANINGDYIIKSPKGNIYEIIGETCSCPDFVVARSNQSRCKHLIFRDWHIQYMNKSSLLEQQNK